MTRKRIFKEGAFYHCYDCGWGERGIHEYAIDFDQARAILVSYSGEDTAKQWEESEETYLEFGVDYYMVHESDFDEELWEGTDDW